MKKTSFLLITAFCSVTVFGQTKEATDTVAKNENKRILFMDVHHLEPGKVKFADVKGAHARDLAVQGKFNVDFIKFWVDSAKGEVYCLSEAENPEAIRHTHNEAHGLLPSEIYAVSEGPEAKLQGGMNLYLDIHRLGAGNVTAEAVAKAHIKDLAVQKKFGVNFINYWVNEEDGIVFCLSEAATREKVIQTHKEAHGLLPTEILEVKQGQ